MRNWLADFDWQTHIITEEAYGDDCGRTVTYYRCTQEPYWYGEELTILMALMKLSDEELKVCLFHQPMLHKLVTEILVGREFRHETV